MRCLQQSDRQTDKQDDNDDNLSQCNVRGSFSEASAHAEIEFGKERRSNKAELDLHSVFKNAFKINSESIDNSYRKEVKYRAVGFTRSIIIIIIVKNS